MASTKYMPLNVWGKRHMLSPDEVRALVPEGLPLDVESDRIDPREADTWFAEYVESGRRRKSTPIPAVGMRAAASSLENFINRIEKAGYTAGLESLREGLRLWREEIERDIDKHFAVYRRREKHDE